MGNFFRKLFDLKLTKKQCKVLMLGLDGAGKTTILYSLKFGQIIHSFPTVGFNVEELNYKSVKLMVWDVGGQQRLRQMWYHYYNKCKGLIFVVDSSDHETVELAKSQLKKITEHEEMKNAVVLILANKRDVATMSVEALCSKLELEKLDRNWAIFPICGIKQKGSNLEEAMEWLVENLNKNESRKKTVKYI